MRNNVTFRHPAEFVTSEEAEGVLVVGGAAWFSEILSRIEALVIHGEPIQEDWGVVFFTNRDGCRFWIGISAWDEGAWIAHVHHHSFAWMQRLTPRGKGALARLANDLHSALNVDPAVTEVRWHREADMSQANPEGAATPDAL